MLTVARLALCASFVCLGSVVYPKICGYARLYHQKSGAAVHLIYDRHDRIANLTDSEMWLAPYEQVKSKLYRSEQHILTLLETLNGQAPANSVEVIWESHPRMFSGGYYPQFIVMGERFVKEQFTNLSYIHADTCRATGLFGLLTIKDFSYCNLSNVSFSNPVPLPDERQIRIIQNSKVCYDQYARLRQDTVQKLKVLESGAKNNVSFVRHAVVTDPTMVAVTDLEMLSHILASSKKKILLYAGSHHCENIRKFLLNTGEYRERDYWVNTNRQELDNHLLNKLLVP
jgi:hypothetical protein